MTAPNLLEYAIYALYAAEGFVICGGNGLLFLAIMMEKTLRKRKEMLIVAGLCAADFIYGMGTLLLNVYRVAIIILGLHSSPATAWKCVTMPHIFMAKIGGQLTAMMNLAVSVDRYFAVAYPLDYMKLSVKYAKLFLAAIFVYFIGSSATMIGSTYFDEPIFDTYTRLCVNAVFPRWYALYDSTFIVVVGGLAVLVYMGVYLAYRSYVRQATTGRFSDHLSHTQRQLTITLGMISFCTLVFFVIPFGITAYYVWRNIKTPYTVPLAMLTRISTIFNFVIYIYRQREVRPGIAKLLCCGRPTSARRPTVTVTIDRREDLMELESLVVRSRSEI